MLPGITGKSTLSATAHKKHSNSLLFRAVGKHSCCPKYYRKVICIIHLGGPLPVFDSLFLERLSHGGHHDSCSGCQVGRMFFFHPSFLPLFSSLFPFLTSLTLSKSWQLPQMAETLQVRVEAILQIGTLWFSLTSETSKKQQPWLQAASFLVQQRAHGACSNFQNQREK